MTYPECILQPQLEEEFKQEPSESGYMAELGDGPGGPLYLTAFS